MNRNVKLGKLGEKTFDAWCTSVELVANKSNEDEMGWDFYVEFPFKKSGSTPMDMQPTPIECKIQVKATRKHDKKIDIEVSNLFRLIRTLMPVFICIFEFDEKDQVISAYLIHIWEDIIGKTLKRVRELDVSGEGDELNKKTICNKVVGCVIGMVGMPTLINQAGYQYLITPEKITIGPTLVCEEGEAIDKNEIEGMIEEFSEQFCKEDYFPIIFDGLLI